MRLLSLLALCLCCIASPINAASTGSAIADSDYHYYHPVTASASALPEAAGKALDTLSVAVIKQGRVQAIPFQFEEYDRLGMIYLDGAAKEQRVGAAGKLDGNDLLVFMYRDSSTERWGEHTVLAQGKMLKELHFKQADGQSRYAYLLENNPLRSSARYVRYAQDKGEITGANYFFKFKPKNLAVTEEYRLSNNPELPPQQAENLFKDSLFELKTSVVFKFIRFTFNSQRNLKMRPVAAWHGPVRVPIILKAQSTFMGIPVFTMYTQMNAYGHALNAPGIEVNKPRMKSLIKNLRRAARYLLEPAVSFHVDYQHFADARIQIERTSREHAGQGIVDGTYNAYENAMRATFLPGQWLWFQHPQRDWKILTTSALPEEFLNLDGLNPQVIYRDNNADSPRVGVKMRGEKVALKELSRGFKLADTFFKTMRPYDLDGIFLAVMAGVEQGKPFAQILQEQNISKASIQELFDIFQLALDIDNIARLVDSGSHFQGSTTLGAFLQQAGLSADSAAAFMAMFQLDFDPEEAIDDLPRYTHQLMQRLYLGYRDKLKNGVTVWTPQTQADFDPAAFNKQLNHPPRLQ